MKPSVKSLIRITTAFVLLYWLVNSGRLQFSVFLSLGWSPTLVILLSAVGATLFLGSIRWWLLLQSHQVQIPLAHALHLGFMGYFASIFVPGGLGVDAVRAYYLMSEKKYAAQKSLVLSSIIMDRVVGLYSLILIALTSAVLWKVFKGDVPILNYLLGFSLMLLVGLSGVTAILCSKRIFQHLSFLHRIEILIKFAKAMQVYRHDYYTLSFAFLVSLTHYALIILAAYCGFTLFEVTVDSLTLALTIPFIQLARALPITPMGLGVSDTVGHEIFSAFSIGYGAEVVMLIRLAMITLSSLGAISYFKTSHLRKQIIDSSFPQTEKGEPSIDN